MTDQVWQSDLSALGQLELDGGSAEAATWKGVRALRLNGLALVPGLELLDGTVEVRIAIEKPGYPGIAFGVRDRLNYELVYAVPAASGLLDAVQYDPVFRGINTWQLHNGSAYQGQAIVPLGEWFTLHLHLHGGCAAVSVGDQAPLVVDQLAYDHLPGRVGLNTYHPTYFSGLRITSNGHPCPPAVQREPLADCLREWFLEGFGRVACEPPGFLNLNRHLPATQREAVLSRSFTLSQPADLKLAFGFSDELSLEVDGQTCFQGSHQFTGFEGYEGRGWVLPGAHSVAVPLAAGRHQIKARLKENEDYGWGLVLQVQAPPRAGLRWAAAIGD